MFPPVRRCVRLTCVSMPPHAHVPFDGPLANTQHTHAHTHTPCNMPPPFPAHTPRPRTFDRLPPARAGPARRVAARALPLSSPPWHSYPSITTRSPTFAVAMAAPSSKQSTSSRPAAPATRESEKASKVRKKKVCDYRRVLPAGRRDGCRRPRGPASGAESQRRTLPLGTGRGPGGSGSVV